MNCLSDLEINVAAASTLALLAICALILGWIARNNRFAGKSAFLLTLVAMLWWLLTVSVDLSSQDEACKIGWSLAAWPGITLLPIAWTFFVFDYTLNAAPRRRPGRLLLYVGLPVLVSLFALTNDQTQLIYGPGTHMVTQVPHPYVVFDHGPVFYIVATCLYLFVSSAVGVLVYALFNAKKIIRPFLAVLLIITAAPVAVNLGYIVWGLTLFGFDPTPFMFAVSLIALSWLLLNNTLMDTAAQGRSLLFYATRDPMFIIDAGGRFVGANPAAKTLFSKHMPRPGEKLDKVEKVGPVVRAFLETGKFESDEPIRLRGRFFDPRALPIESPIQAKRSLLGWSISLVDITAREHAAEALREALAHAEAANHAKSQFLAMISHELRTPMSSVKGGLDLALLGVGGEISPQLRNLLTIAQRNSLRLLKLVDDVLDLQKLDLSTIKLESHDLDADAFLRDVREEYDAYASEAKVRLDIVSEDVNLQLRADPNRLKQVVGNVISNAIKFSPEDGQVRCSTRLVGNRLRLSVQDSGIGIPDGQEDKVFGRFSQVESGTSITSGGSGLGMHIAKLLIERMGGAISYDSELGVGTTFHIDMALAEAPGKQPALAAGAA